MTPSCRNPESKDIIFKQEQPWDTPSSPKSSRQAVREPDEPTWKLSGTQGTPAFWEISGAPLPHLKRVYNCIHPKQSLSRSSEIAVPLRRDIIGLRGGRVVRAWWFYCAGESRLQHYFGTTCGRRCERPSQNSAKHLPENMIHLLRSITSTTTCPIVHLYRKCSASTLGTQDPRRGKEGAIEKQIAGK